jgi:LysR family transcriptional regulator, low CO2-responsive transcriptional regulator
MTPSQARAFHAVAVEGSFTAAARKLSVSQPTITNQVKQLELLYNVDLFHRGSRGVKLTRTGEELLAVLRRMFGSYREAVEFLQASKGMRHGHLRLGSYGPYAVTEMMARFRKLYPPIEISLSFQNSKHLEASLLNYDLDIGVFTRTQDDPEFYTLSYACPLLVAIVPRRPPWDGRETISIEDLRKFDLIERERGSAVRIASDSILGEFGNGGEQRIEISSREGVVSAVSKGLGAALIFDEGTLPESAVVKLRIDACAASSQIDVVCLDERRKSPIIRAFLAIVEEMIQHRKPQDAEMRAGA